MSDLSDLSLPELLQHLLSETAPPKRQKNHGGSERKSVRSNLPKHMKIQRYYSVGVSVIINFPAECQLLSFLFGN